jgi:ketosteroid isomerase-like protein
VATNTDIIRSGYEAFGRGDIPAVLAVLSPDITWTSPDTVATGGTFKGHDEVLGFFASIPETYEVIEVRPERFVEQGETVVVLGRHVGRSRAADFDVPFAHAWTVHDGLATSFFEYFDTVKLNAALG